MAGHFLKRENNISFVFKKIAAKMLCMIALSVIFTAFSAGCVYAYDDIVVVIDPGHGGVVTTDNSNGGCTCNGIYEKDVNLITATALYNELSQYQNVTVYMTRNADVEMSLADRINFAKSVDANVLVSVHYNASDDHIFYGAEIFTSMYGQPRATGYGLATCIQKQWESFGSPFKGIKTRAGDNGDYYGLIRQGCDLGMPVIILEHGYLDNDKDFDRMNNADKWQQLGVADAAGIAEYYGLSKDTVKARIIPTVKVSSSSQPALPDDTPPTSVNLVVDEYDEESGRISYSVSAAEDSDDLMYFGVVKGPVTDETVFYDLNLWDNTKGVQSGTIKVPAEYSGTLTARVYNSYELYSDSESVDLSKVNEPDEAENPDNGEDPDNDEDSDGNADEDSVPGDGDSSVYQVLDTIILGGSDAADPIEITPDMVDEAEDAVSIENKAKIGLAGAAALVCLVTVIAVALGIYKTVSSVKKGKKHGPKNMYDWEDEDDY